MKIRDGLISFSFYSHLSFSESSAVTRHSQAIQLLRRFLLKTLHFPILSRRTIFVIAWLFPERFPEYINSFSTYLLCKMLLHSSAKSPLFFKVLLGSHLFCETTYKTLYVNNYLLCGSPVISFTCNIHLAPNTRHTMLLYAFNHCTFLFCVCHKCCVTRIPYSVVSGGIDDDF